LDQVGNNSSKGVSIDEENHIPNINIETLLENDQNGGHHNSVEKLRRQIENKMNSIEKLKD